MSPYSRLDAFALKPDDQGQGVGNISRCAASRESRQVEVNHIPVRKAESQGSSATKVRRTLVSS